MRNQFTLEFYGDGHETWVRSAMQDLFDDEATFTVHCDSKITTTITVIVEGDDLPCIGRLSFSAGGSGGMKWAAVAIPAAKRSEAVEMLKRAKQLAQGVYEISSASSDGTYRVVGNVYKTDVDALLNYVLPT